AGEQGRLGRMRVAPGRFMVLMIVVALEAVGMSGASIDLALAAAHGHRAWPFLGQVEGRGTRALCSRSRREGEVGRLMPTQFAGGDQEAAAFDIEKSQADQDDESITCDLDQMDGQSDRLRGCTKQDGSDGYDDDGDHRLDGRRHKWQHNAAAPGLLIGDEVRGDHGLAMPRADSVENAIDEG